MWNTTEIQRQNISCYTEWTTQVCRKKTHTHPFTIALCVHKIVTKKFPNAIWFHWLSKCTSYLGRLNLDTNNHTVKSEKRFTFIGYCAGIIGHLLHVNFTINLCILLYKCTLHTELTCTQLSLNFISNNCSGVHHDKIYDINRRSVRARLRFIWNIRTDFLYA